MSDLGKEIRLEYSNKEIGSVWEFNRPLMGGFYKKSPDGKFIIVYSRKVNDPNSSRILVIYDSIIQFDDIFPKIVTAAVDNFGHFVISIQNEISKSCLELYDLNKQLLFKKEYLVAFDNIIFAETDLVVANTFKSLYNDTFSNCIIIINLNTSEEHKFTVDTKIKSIFYHDKVIEVTSYNDIKTRYTLIGEELE